MSPGSEPVEPRRRLHPLSPLLRGGRLAVLVIVGISWQGYQNLGTRGWAVAVGLAAVVVLVFSVLSWLVTGFHVVGRELRIYEGLLNRRTRAIPLERLQSVEVVRPVLARLLGLAELRLEVVGAAKTEAPLAFLTVDEATELRRRLLAQGRRAPVPAQAPAGPGEAVPEPAVLAERPVHTIDNGDLLLSQLLRPHWWFLPLGIAGPIVYFATAEKPSIIAVASTVTAVIGVIQAPVRALLADWRFTLGAAADGLRLHRGLLETRSQTVPPGRIQSLRVEWPLLWRLFGWVRVQMHIAGVVQGHQDAERAGLLPVAAVPVAERVIPEAVPGFHLTSVRIRPVPPRAGWLAPLRRFVLGYELTPVAFVSRDGLLTRRLVVVPYGRMQSVRIRQGPLQRMLRLASVWVDTAGGGIGGVALHRDAREAVALATELAARSRAARVADEGARRSRDEPAGSSQLEPGQWPIPSPPSTGITAPLT